MSLDIASGRERNELYSTIISNAVELIDSDAGGIGLFVEEKNAIAIPLVYNLPDKLIGKSFRLGQDIFSMAINTNQAQITDDYSTMENQVKELCDSGMRALSVVPLRARGKILGILWVAMLKPWRVFSDYDKMLLESVGGQAAVAIDNISLFDEQRYISDTLQRGLLPGQLPGLKQTDIGMFYASATEAAVIGGDFYDAIRLTEDRISFLVGDVSGKGVEATAEAAMARYSLRAMSFQNPDPAAILTSVNPIIAGQLTSGHFITLAYGLYDSKSAQVTLSVAGHPYPLLYSSSKKKASPIIGKDPAFALILDYKYSKTDLKLLPGDILVFYTDGITELRRNKEFFSTERLSDLIASYAKLKAQEIVDKIIDDAMVFSSGRRIDDIVLMIIKRTG
ncbi:MAG: GAF domain-containing SpoIIE family protein phosphatase [Actinomycetota bacterium]